MSSKSEFPQLGVALPTGTGAGTAQTLAFLEACTDAAARSDAALILLAGHHGRPEDLQNVPLIPHLLGHSAATPLAALFLTAAWPLRLLIEHVETLAALVSEGGSRFIPVLASGRRADVTDPTPSERRQAADAAFAALSSAGMKPWIASERGRALLRAAGAEGWIANATYGDEELLRQLDAVGKIPNRAVRRDIVCMEDGAEAHTIARSLLEGGYRSGMRLEHVISGDPPECVARIRHLGDLGFTHVLIRPMTRDADLAAETITTVARALRAAATHSPSGT